MYFDLEKTIRTDGAFRHQVQVYMKQLDVCRDKMASQSKFVETYNETLRDLLILCRWNISLLTPMFFRYPENKPLRYSDYPFAMQMFNFQIGGFTVVKGSRQTSKSTSFCVRQQMLCRMIPGFKSMYICPLSQQLETYANKMREISAACVDQIPKTKFKQNLHYREFPNGSTIELVYVNEDANVVRGKTAKEILYDEYQGFDPDLETEVDQIQRSGEMPVTIFAGTSLTTDTALEGKWAQSSGGVWLMKCSAGHDNIPLPEHGVMEMIQPQGPSCRKCGELLDVRAGTFVHAHPELLDQGKVGFHIPQIIIPAVVNNQIRWMDIYERKFKDYRKFLQEILGIATEDGEREITKQNLVEMCNLGNIEALQQKAANGKYEWVVSGCDWGGSDYNPNLHTKVSTTVHAMIGITPLGEFDIIHLKRYAGMNYDDITGDIIYNHKRLRGFALASDFGVGAVYNSALRKSIATERHLVFCYVGPNQPLIAEPGGDHMMNQWSLNKTESISLTFDAVRTKRLRCFSWQFAGEYLMDFLNMYRAPGERVGQSGASTFLYKAHSSKPNDTLQAVNYAYMLGKILRGEPMFNDVTVRARLESMLRGADIYLSRMPRAISG
jgi:hypothetical protein